MRSLDFHASWISVSVLAALAAVRAAPDPHGTRAAAERPDRIGFTALYERVAPAIVAVTCKSIGPDRDYFGTGAVIDPKGILVTSTTVLPSGAREIRVYTTDGAVLAAKLLATDPLHELAAAAIEGWGDRPILPLGRSAGLRLGQVVLTFGNAFHSLQIDGHVTAGVGVVSGLYTLSAARLEKDYQAAYAGPVIETDAAINPGMDGGPLVDAGGRIVGLLSLNFSATRWLGTAVPVDALASRIQAIREGRWVAPAPAPGSAFLGASLRDGDGGAVLAQVVARGPADRAGLRPGDVIRSVGGEAVADAAALRRRLAASSAGDPWVLRVRRGAREREAIVELGGDL